MLYRARSRTQYKPDLFELERGEVGRGQPQEPADFLEWVEPLAEAFLKPISQFAIIQFRMCSAFESGNLELAHELAQKALDLLSRSVLEPNEAARNKAFTLRFMARVHLAEGNINDALETTLQASELLAKYKPDPNERIQTKAMLAYLYERRGEIE